MQVIDDDDPMLDAKTEVRPQEEGDADSGYTALKRNIRFTILIRIIIITIAYCCAYFSRRSGRRGLHRRSATMAE